ncbi:MAG: amidohydrolase family protein [Nitrosopumilus sp.]|nr:amidohydrolase family protein [Nitrosopumilus sp.]
MQNSCDLLITNANVVIPQIGIVHTNILIENEKIKNITNSYDNVSYSKKIDVRHKFVLPGLIDPHIHYGVFSPIDQSSKTESRSAAIGGVTTIMRMLRLHDSYKQNICEQLEASKNNHYIDYAIHASISNPKQIDDINYLCNLGISSFKLYMNLGSSDNRILMDMKPYEHKLLPKYVNISDNLCNDVLEKSSDFDNSVVLIHAEDHIMCCDLINKNKLNTPTNNIDKSSETNYNPLDLWSKCRPQASEVIAIKKIMNLGRKFQSNLYFVHIGSNDSLDAILLEKQMGGCNVYVETCPHYLTHSTDYDNLKGKVVPPLRSKNDIASLWVALRNGVIDTIGTDHVANNLNLKYGEKRDIWSSLAGFPGVATMLPVLLHYGVNSKQLSIERLVELTSYNASKIFGMHPKKGTIQKNSDADLVVIDLDLNQKVTPDILQSSSDYSIYDDLVLQGWPILTISRGEVIMENGIICEDKIGHGQFIKRSASNMKI